MNRLVLLNPGPVNVSERVRAALAGPDLCHREPEFFDLQDEIRSRLLEVFGLTPTSHTAILLTGSGTAAVEASVVTAAGPKSRILVVDNGVYGDRIARMAAAHGIEFDRFESPWTESLDVGAVLARLTTGRYDILAAVHHETTTGLVNPIVELGNAAQRVGARSIVDSVSGLAGDPFDFWASGAHLVACTANKCLQGLPGVAFVLARREVMARLSCHPPRSLYLNLVEYEAHQARRSTPFTPAVQVAYALREALRELAEETVAGRIERYRRASAFLRAEFEGMGLRLLLPAEVRSNTITALELPPGVAYPPLHDALKERGYVVYAGQGSLSERAFRVANMGWISQETLADFTRHLREVLSWKR